jgi:ferrochelatase
MESKKAAVILVNLGTPKSPTAKDVRAFLKPFLWDRRVVEVPRPIWWLILNGFILPFRPSRIAKVYQSLWDEYGDSPLRLISRAQAEGLSALLEAECPNSEFRVYQAMTYGEPSIQQSVESARDAGFDRIVVLPLYPQYSGSTTAAVYDQLARLITTYRHIPDFSVVKSYHDHPLFIQALAASVRAHWQQSGKGDYLLMSYHGVPQSYVDKGDPYQQQCIETSQLLASALELDESEWGLSFQSRLGKAEWIKPYTQASVESLGARGLAKLDVVCPSFSADCIETIDEITIENGEAFREAGGGELRLVACLNEQPAHIELMKSLILERV